MIKHHPSIQLLAGYAAGELPASMAIGVSIHCQMCEECRDKVVELTAQLAADDFKSFETECLEAAESSFETARLNDDDVMLMDFGNMIDAITSDDEISEQAVQRSSMIKVKGKNYELPNALNNVRMSNWLNLGKLSRSSLNLDEGAIHSHLLHIDADGEVPTHTHKGFEITLLLDGSFEDEMGTYVAGDFIELNGEHNHKPRTKDGCLCYTVADDALQFTEGFHKLFNPIGSLLY